MARIENYNPTLHDIYTYYSTPSIVRENPPGSNAHVEAIGYNSQNMLLNSDYGLPQIDWSGLHVRVRGFIAYGWEPNPDWWLSPPIEALKQFNPGPPITSGERPSNLQPVVDYYLYGNPPGNFERFYDYNNWNNGQWAGVLISPKHLLVTAHYASRATEMICKFIGKNSQIFTKTATKVAEFYSESQMGAIRDETLINLSFGIYQDMYVYALNVPFTSNELEHVKIYPFVKWGTLAPNTKVFIQDPNGRFLIDRIFGIKNSDLSLSTRFVNQEFVVRRQEYSINSDYPRNTQVHVGDSGSPGLVNVNGETCFLYLRDGGHQVYPENLQNLKEYVYQDCGYEIQEVDGGYRWDVLSELQTTEKINPLSSSPYLSRFSSNIQSLNFSNIGYFKSLNVQASELNELQESAYNQNSKTIEMIHNWFGNYLLNPQNDGITFNGPTNISPVLQNIFNKDIFNLKIPILTPLSKNQIYKTTNNYISISAGWYFLKKEDSFLYDFSEITIDPQLSFPTTGIFTMYKWVYNPTNSVVQMDQNDHYLSIRTFPYHIKGDRNFLADNIPYYGSHSNGGDRFGIELGPEYYINPLPTSGVTLSEAILLYRKNDRYYLSNGYEIN